MSSKEKMLLKFGLCPSSKCDRYCAHCAADATMRKGQFFSIENALLLSGSLRRFLKGKEGRKLNLKLYFDFTGDGEPLINPNIVQILDIFFGLNSGSEVGASIVTSGINSLPEEKRLLEIVKKPYAKEISFNISFNLFQKKFPERLIRTLNLLFENGIAEASIKICQSPIIIFQTINKLDHLLEKNFLPWIKEVKPFLKFSPVNIGNEIEKDIMDFLKVRFINLEILKFEYVYFRTHLMESFSFSTRFGEKRINYSPHILRSEGRAKNLAAIRTRKICPFLKEAWDSHPHVGADGFFYPSCQCPPEESLRLGHVSDKIKNTLIAFGVFRKILLYEIIYDRDYHTNVCEHCVKTANRLADKIGRLPIELFQDF